MCGGPWPVIQAPQKAGQHDKPGQDSKTTSQREKEKEKKGNSCCLKTPLDADGVFHLSLNI